MGIGNNLRILRAKWWILLLAAVVGALVGTYLATSHNDAIRTRWRAQAPVTFIAFTEEDADASSSKNANSTSSDIDAQAEGVRAQLLLEDTLRANPRLSIQVDRANNVLLFTAIGRNGETTLDEAVELRSIYQSLSSEVLNIDEINTTIDSLLIDIVDLDAKIAKLEIIEPSPEATEITAQRTVLVAEIDTLNERQAELRIWVLNPELRPSEDDFFGIEPDVADRSDTSDTTIPEEPVIVSTDDLKEEIDENARVLARLHTQLDIVPDPPEVDELDQETALALEAMQLDATELQDQYVELLQVADGRSPGGFFEEPTATDETAGIRPVNLFALVGLLAGALVASIVLVGLDKARKTIWTASALEGVTCLGVIDRNRSDGLPADVWYPTSISRRRRDIQTFRATIDSITQEQPAIVGFFGVKTASDEIGELAADLATAYTVAGRDVLLIDANAFEPNALAEYGDQTSSLTKILVRKLPVGEAIRAIDELIDATPQVIPHLTSLHVDAATHDPIDAIASPNSRNLMEIARERFDIVIVAGPAISDPLSDTVARRIDFAVLAGHAGTTTMPQITTATAILADRRTETPGVVLLKGRRKAFFPRMGELAGSARAAGSARIEQWRARAAQGAPTASDTETDVDVRTDFGADLSAEFDTDLGGDLESEETKAGRSGS